MFHHSLNTDRVLAAAPGPAACLIILLPSHCVVGPGRSTISVAEVLIPLYSLKFAPEHVVYGKVTSQVCEVNIAYHKATTSPHRVHCPAWRLE
jgi:hypothetical protein